MENDYFFRCCRVASKCEWNVLSTFVEVLNRKYNQDYQRRVCLDVASSAEAEPEVLCRNSKGDEIVIEFKKWSGNSLLISEHAKIHQFMEIFTEKYHPFFPVIPNPILRFAQKTLEKSKKNKIPDFVNSIIEQIRNGIFSSNTPFQWQLYSDSNPEKENHGKLGFSWNNDWHTDLNSENLTPILSLYQQQLNQFNTSFERKFKNYLSSKKIVLIQIILIQDIFSLETELLEYIKKFNFHDSVDEVWLAFHDWIDENDYQIGWELTYTKKVL
jgi:hypothetical protein